MKTFRLIAMWAIYISCIPVGLIFSAVVVTRGCIKCKLNCGEFAVKDMLEAYIEGIKQGHKQNLEIIVNS